MIWEIFGLEAFAFAAGWIVGATVRSLRRERRAKRRKAREPRPAYWSYPKEVKDDGGIIFTRMGPAEWVEDENDV